MQVFNPTTIETHSGRAFDLQRPLPDQVCLEDIARGLSLTCRFTGQVPWPYCVSYHCVRMAQQFTRHPRIAMWCLLHDAHEAYWGDDSSPKKRLLKDALGDYHYSRWPAAIQWAINNHFGFSPTIEEIRAVERADAECLRREAADLMPSRGDGWDWRRSWGEVQALAGQTLPWDCFEAERRYTALFRQLHAKVTSTRN